MLKTLAIIVFYALVSGLAGWTVTDIATDYGLFGSCFEGGCGYGAVFIGFPVSWLALFILLLLTQRWSHQRRLGSLLRGRWSYATLFLGFPALWLIFFVLFFVLMEIEETMRLWGYIS